MNIQILRNNLQPQDISNLTGHEITARRRELRISVCSAAGRIAFAIARNRNPSHDVASFQFWLNELIAFQVAVAAVPLSKTWEGDRE